jgi:hypothetical protein
MAFLKIDEATVRLFANALNDTSLLRVRLTTMLDLFPHLPDDGVIVLSSTGDGTVAIDDANVADQRAVAVAEAVDPPDPWPAGGGRAVNPSFGWRRHGTKIVKAKEEQEIMKRTLQGLKRGWGNSQIADDLNARSLRTRRGSKWDSGGISRLRRGPILHASNAALKKRYE